MFSVEVFVNRILATRGCKADEPEQLTVPLGDNILVPFIKGVAEQTPLVFGMLPQLPRIDFVSRSINALPVARAGQSHTDLRSRRNPLFDHRWGELSAFACRARKLWGSTDYNRDRRLLHDFRKCRWFGIECELDCSFVGKSEKWPV